MGKRKKHRKVKASVKLRLIGQILAQESAKTAHLQARVDQLSEDAREARRKASGVFGHFQEVL